MDFLQLVEKNRSYRGFDESAQVSRGQLERLVECARLPFQRQHAAAEILSFLRCRNQRAHPAAHRLGRAGCRKRTCPIRGTGPRRSS